MNFSGDLLSIDTIQIIEIKKKIFVNMFKAVLRY